MNLLSILLFLTSLSAFLLAQNVFLRHNISASIFSFYFMSFCTTLQTTETKVSRDLWETIWLCAQINKKIEIYFTKRVQVGIKVSI